MKLIAVPVCSGQNENDVPEVLEQMLDKVHVPAVTAFFFDLLDPAVQPPAASTAAIAARIPINSSVNRVPAIERSSHASIV